MAGQSIPSMGPSSISSTSCSLHRQPAHIMCHSNSGASGQSQGQGAEHHKQAGGHSLAEQCKKERKPGVERRERRCCVSSAVRPVACSPRRPSCIITTVVIVAQDCQVLPPTRKVPTAAAAALRCPILMHPDSRGRARVRAAAAAAAAAEHSIQFESLQQLAGSVSSRTCSHAVSGRPGTVRTPQA